MAFNTTSTYLTQGMIPDIPGILYGQNERVDELNERLFQRVIPTNELQPNFDPRPVSTKYSLFPILDPRSPTTYPINRVGDYNTETSFAPMTNRGPVNGFLSNVDIESKLRSQFFALQRGVGQNTYIPSSQSDLYNIGQIVGRQEAQPFDFRKDEYFSPNIIHLNGIGTATFANHTREQMRNSYVQTINDKHI
jgi:hypothetical protein